MPRLKRIEKDEARFVITPLTTLQVEQYTESGDENMGRIRLSFYEVICNSLNNVPEVLPKGWETEGYSKTLIAEVPCTPEGLRNSWDTVTLTWLFNEILQFTGLILADKTQVPAEGAQGEKQAAVN